MECANGRRRAWRKTMKSESSFSRITHHASRPPIRAITFDVGGTLIDPWPSVGHVYAAVAAESGLPAYDPAVLNAQFVAAWRAKANFDYSRAAWASLVVSTFAGSEGEFGLMRRFL